MMDLEKELPSVSFSPDVVAFLQGIVLILVTWQGTDATGNTGKH